MANKYDELRKKNTQAIFDHLSDSLSRDVKKETNNGVRQIKEKINSLPWDMSQKIVRTADFIAGTIAGHNVEFAFNEEGELTSRLDGSVSTLSNIEKLRKKLPSNNEFIKSLHGYLEAEDKDDEPKNNDDGEEENKDALDETDDFLSKIDLSELSKKAKLELIENIVDELQNSTDKDEFDDVMNEIYDLLDNYYVNKDEEEEEKEEEPEGDEDENPEGEEEVEEEPIEGEEEPTEPVKPVE